MPTFKKGVCQLQLYLDRHNMSQSELARLTGVSQRSISEYASNKQVMNVNTARAIALVFDCEMDDLYIW